MSVVTKVLWQSNLGPKGVLYGICLDPEFARACSRIPLTPSLEKSLCEYVWKCAKPTDWKKDYVPSGLITFVDNSLLLRSLYHRHSSASGQDLGLDIHSWDGGNTNTPLRYSYHQQGRAGDFWANLWLQYAFSWWVRFAQQQIT